MKKTKIICTMGPNTDDREIMRQLAQSGMDVARFNFSHGDYEEHRKRLEILQSVAGSLGILLTVPLVAFVSAAVMTRGTGRPGVLHRSGRRPEKQ